MKSPPSRTRGTIVNQVGAAGQVTGGVVMGIGQALSEGTQIADDGRVRNPYLLDYKLQTSADVPDIKVGFIGIAGARRGPERLEGPRRAALHPHAGRDRERDRQRDRGAGPAAAGDARIGCGAAVQQEPRR